MTQVAVLLPCHNEEQAIAAVIKDFKAALPDADIYVYNNNSTDQTANVAEQAGAIVRHETRKGKGNVVRRMFADIDADIYIMADGDGTYEAKAAPKLIQSLIDNHADMIIGARAKEAGDDLYRRGIYTVWRRGNPYPSMINFDAPDRSTCEVRRDRSNTPLQALTLLNDPVYVEMATEYAKAIESWNGSDRDRVVRAFRRATSRRPSEVEVRTLLELYQKNHSWFAVAQVLLNLDESISKS